MSLADMQQAADKLNVVIEDLNAAIRARGANIKAYVPLEENLSLGWDKLNSKWQLVTVYRHINGDVDTQSLINATWARRVAAVQFVERLLEFMEDEARMAAAKIQDAVAFTTDLAARLRKVDR